MDMAPETPSPPRSLTEDSEDCKRVTRPGSMCPMTYHQDG